jgi:hypothetical protein
LALCDKVDGDHHCPFFSTIAAHQMGHGQVLQKIAISVLAPRDPHAMGGMPVCNPNHLSRRYIRKLTLYGDLLRIENAHKMIHKVT